MSNTEKLVVGSFFTNTEQDYEDFYKLFVDAGYEVARQAEIAQSAVVIKDVEVPEEETEQSAE